MKYDSISKLGRPKNEPEAELLANRLAERLEEKLGGKWKPRVWNNLGWCYDAFLVGGSIAVNEIIFREQDPTYHASLNSDLSSSTGTDAFWADKNSYSTPEDAVLAQLNKARKKVEELLKTVKYNEHLLNGAEQVEIKIT